jgi:uncharacterized protein YceK
MRYNMKKILALFTLLLLTLILLSSGCASKPPTPPPEKNYTNAENPNNYILLNNTSKTVFIHTGSGENYKGTYVETETDYTFFIDGGSSQVFEKLDNVSIAIVPKEKKYLDPIDSSKYIKFNTNDKSFALSLYGFSFKGYYDEEYTSYSLFPDIGPYTFPIGKSITKIDDEHIGLNIGIGTIEFTLEKSPIFKLKP